MTNDRAGSGWEEMRDIVHEDQEYCDQGDGDHIAEYYVTMDVVQIRYLEMSFLMYIHQTMDNR